VTEVAGGSTAPGEIADLRRVGISPDFRYPVTVSASVWKEANHSRQSPGSDDDRSPCRSGSSRQESGAKRRRVTIKLLIPVAATGGCASSCTGE
jgi:hypothetical protein